MIYEIFREASVRLPANINVILGIGGGIVLGQGAIQAGLVGGLTVVIVVFTALASFSTANSSKEEVLRYSWPMLAMTTKANVPYILETFGLFFPITWYSQMALALSGLYYTSAQGFSELLGASNYKWLLLVLLPLSYILVLLVPSVIELRSMRAVMWNAT